MSPDQELPPEESSIEALLGSDVLGSDGGPAPGTHELRGIVARATRRYRRAAALAAAATLALGGAAGYLIARRSAPATSTVAVGHPAPTVGGTRSSPGQAGASGAAGPANAPFFAGPAPSGLVTNVPHYTALFTRQAGGVSIRGFLTNFPQPVGMPATATRCGFFGPPAFTTELSTAKMVGNAMGVGAVDRTKALSALAATVVGQVENDPTAAVLAATGPGVAAVTMKFAGGDSDRMAPVQGWVALAAPVAAAAASSMTAPVGTITALDASGRVLSTQPVTLADGRYQPFVAGTAPPASASAPPAVGHAFVCAPARATTTPATTGTAVPAPATTAPAK